MTYCIYNYTVKLGDGSFKSGVAPYYAADIKDEDLIQDVKTFYACDIEVQEVKVLVSETFENVKAFLTYVRNLESFQYMRKLNNYAGDMMQKYFPEETQVM